MPHDRPNFERVRWNHGAASEAARALRRAADSLERAAAESARSAAEASWDWKGNYGTVFSKGRHELEGEARGLAAECRAAAQAIERASVRAREEQARRDREAAEWEERQRRRSSNARPSV